MASVAENRARLNIMPYSACGIWLALISLAVIYSSPTRRRGPRATENARATTIRKEHRHHPGSRLMLHEPPSPERTLS